MSLPVIALTALVVLAVLAMVGVAIVLPVFTIWHIRNGEPIDATMSAVFSVVLWLGLFLTAAALATELNIGPEWLHFPTQETK